MTDDLSPTGQALIASIAELGRSHDELARALAQVKLAFDSEHQLAGKDDDRVYDELGSVMAHAYFTARNALQGSKA